MKKMLKVLALGLICTISMVLLVSCGTSQNGETTSNQETPTVEEKATLNVIALGGPTGMGMVKLMDDNEQGNTAVDYQFTIAGAADEITGLLVKGEVDIAAIPANLGAVLYQKTEGDIKVAAINTLGVLYVLEANDGQSIQSIGDLKGKTIVTTGKGTTPEYTLNYLLKANGIDPETDVTIEYKSEAAEVGALFQTGEVEIAMLPQPFVTSVLAKNEGVRVALDMTEEWNHVQAEANNQLITGTVVVRKEVLENNKEAVDLFLQEYQQSIEFINNNIAEGASLVEKYGIIASAAMAEKAIPQCNIVYIQGQEMKSNVEAYLNVLYEANPSAVGGALPDEEYYYIP